jgi:hypothetical protein
MINSKLREQSQRWLGRIRLAPLFEAISIYSTPVPTAMSITAVKATEVARMCKTVEIRGMSELMVFPGMMAREGASATPTAPEWPPIWVAVAVARPASATRKTEEKD